MSDVLRPNIEWTGFLDFAVIHTIRVENFLERAVHFIGVCYILLDIQCYVFVFSLYNG